MKSLHLAFVFAATLVGCASASTPSNPGSKDPTPSDPSKNPPTVRTSLSYDGACSASTCGEVPPSNTAAAPVCTPIPATGACDWADTSSSAATSYRPCSDAECPTTIPGKSVCPADLEFKGANCGSENDGACIWRAACAPPKSTTPCPDANGCGDAVPAIAALCDDGTSAGLACFLLPNGTCTLQADCK